MKKLLLLMLVACAPTITQDAILLDFSGEVLADGSPPITNNTVRNIQTFNGTAKVAIPGRALVHVDPYTNVSLLELHNVHWYQDRGTTWHKYLATVGATTYQVENPYSVAAVRGTEFEVVVVNQSATILVGEGNVSIRTNESQIVIGKHEKVITSKKQRRVKRKLTSVEEQQHLVSKRKDTQQYVQTVRRLQDKIHKRKKAPERRSPEPTKKERTKPQRKNQTLKSETKSNTQPPKFRNSTTVRTEASRNVSKEKIISTTQPRQGNAKKRPVTKEQRPKNKTPFLSRTAPHATTPLQQETDKVRPTQTFPTQRHKNDTTVKAALDKKVRTEFDNGSVRR
ncbi:hypothetical protein CMO91_05270 [Candidatus Woesearchaeota archaeon]|nr:hypothetical protein [Candidatus Woesearchaeota archaeon]